MRRILLLLAVLGAFAVPIQAQAACDPNGPVYVCKENGETGWYAQVFTSSPFVGVHVGQFTDGTTGIVACVGAAGCQTPAGIVWGPGGCYMLIGSLECPVNPPPAPYLGDYIP